MIVNKGKKIRGQSHLTNLRASNVYHSCGNIYNWKWNIVFSGLKELEDLTLKT